MRPIEWVQLVELCLHSSQDKLIVSQVQSKQRFVGTAATALVERKHYERNKSNVNGPYRW